MTQQGYTLFGEAISGNCYKPRLLMTQLGIRFTWVNVDILAGECQSPDFLAKNPNGKVPLLQLPNGEYLSESNAILCYLAEGTPLLPADRLQRARVMEWLFWEQYSHEPVIAVARFIAKYLPPNNPREGELMTLRGKAMPILARLDNHLSNRAFLVAETYTIADIALYAYTHVAEDAGIPLTPWQNIRQWLQRIEATENYLPMIG